MSVTMEVKYVDSQCREIFEDESLDSIKSEEIVDYECGSESYLPEYPKKTKIDQNWVKYDKILIAAVMNRPNLWNKNVSVKSHLIKEAWMEVSQELEGKFDISIIKKRWRNLRDSYSKAKKRVQLNASNNNIIYNKEIEMEGKVEGFRFSKEMAFLDDRVILKRRKKSVPESVTEHAEVSMHNTSFDDLKNSQLSNKSMRDESQNYNMIHKSILQCKEFDKVDGIDGFLIQLGDILRRLPYKNRRFLQNKIMIDALKTEEEAGLF